MRARPELAFAERGPEDMTLAGFPAAAGLSIMTTGPGVRLFDGALPVG